jgi:hypothetical protein
MKYFDANKKEITDSVNRAPTTESPRGTESQYSSLQTWLPEGGSVWYVKVRNPSATDQVFHIYEDWFEWAWKAQGSITFANASQAYTLGGPSDADHVLSVAAYVSRSFYTSALGNMRQYSQTLDKIANFSSIGPRIDGVQKPDIAGPGSMLVSVRDTNIYHVTDQGWVDDDGVAGGDAHYVVMQGTSMATPVVTGAAALVLSKYPTLTPQQVYDSLKLHAVKDAYTGNVPNANWGAGKVDVGFLAELPAVPSDGWVNVSRTGWGGLSPGGIAADAQGNVYATIGKPWTNDSTTLYKSSDQGATWNALYKDIGLGCIAARTNGALFTAQRYGGALLRSVDNGATWSPVGDNHDYTAITPIAGDSLLAAATFGQGVFTSADNGATWSGANNGLPGKRQVPILVAGRNGWMYACANDSVIVRLFRAHRSTMQWQRCENGIDTMRNINACTVTPDGAVFAVASDRVYRSEDNGATWTQMAILNDYLQSVHAISNTTVLVGTVNAGAYRSVDKGATWNAFCDGLTTFNINGMCTTAAGNTFALGNPASVWKRAMGAMPVAPTLLSPANDAVGVPHPVALRWSAAQGATSYTIELSLHQDFSSIDLRVDNLAAVQWPMSKLAVLTPFWWRVRANSNAGTSPWSVAWKFTTAPLPPPAPLQTAPDNGATELTIPVTFQWTPAQTATSYTVQVDTDSSFSNPVFERRSTSGTSAQVTTLSTGTRYYWRVRAENAGGASSWTTAWSFRTKGSALAIPMLWTPANRTRMQPLATSLQWKPTSGATTYHVQIATDSLFSTPFLEDRNDSGAYKNLPTLAFYTDYYWRVRAQSSTDTSAWSLVWTFRTILGKAILISPANDATNQPLTPVFSWAKLNGATAYRLRVSINPTFFPTAFDSSDLTQLSWSGTALAPGTKYYWQVIGKNADGNGAVSDIFNFITEGTNAVSAIDVPGSLLLEPIAPNPASGWTDFGFRIGDFGCASLRVMDVLGRTVAMIAEDTFSPGRHVARWNVTSLPAGMYCVVLTMNGKSVSRMVAVAR